MPPAGRGEAPRPLRLVVRLKANATIARPMKISGTLYSVIIISHLTAAHATQIDYAGAVIYFQSVASSTQPSWTRTVSDERNEQDISVFTFNPQADIQVDSAIVINRGAYHIEVVATQFVWRSAATNILSVSEPGGAATASGSATLQINGSNSASMNFMIQGSVAGTTSNLGVFEYTIQLVHEDMLYTKQIMSSGNSNYTEYGTIPPGIFIYSLSHEHNTAHSATGLAMTIDNAEFILTFIDHAITNVVAGITNMLFQVSGPPSASYHIQTTSNLNHGMWSDATNQATGSDNREVTIPLSPEFNELYFRSDIR